MKLPNVSAYIFPAVLGLLGVILLIRVLIFDHYVLLPEDTHVLILIGLLSTGMVLAIQTLVHISMNYLRTLSVQRARRDTYAEHKRFLSRLDHEMKNPLTAIRAGLQTLLITPLDEQQRQIATTMEIEILRLNRLVTDLRKLAELETRPLTVRPTHIEEMIANLLPLELEAFHDNQRQWESRIRVSRTLWNLDEDLIALALHNLLDNAFKYTHSGDLVRLEVEAHQELIIRVIDTGIGISQADLPHIWEELYRANHTEKIPGNGIGLSLVKAIVEYHHGAVDVVSEPGLGTTITIRLPFISQH